MGQRRQTVEPHLLGQPFVEVAIEVATAFGAALDIRVLEGVVAFMQKRRPEFSGE